MPEIKPEDAQVFTIIKVVGVGGAGGAAVNRMKEAGLKNVQFIAVNTDAKALHNSKADVKVHIGSGTTRGLGAGADPIKGEAAGKESYDEIKNAISGADMVFIALGAGGGTGSGAGYLVAQAAKEEGILTVGVVTKPFSFEGEKRRVNAEWAVDHLRENVDALIVVPNDRLLQTISPTTPLLETFKMADDVLRQGVQGISELITENGLIETDFADVETIMRNAGSALMGIGHASGENRAVLAAQQAIESPLIEVSIDGARGILLNFTGGFDMTMAECAEAAETIKRLAAPDANIIMGIKQKPEMEDEIIVTVVATGFGEQYSGNKHNFGADDFLEPETNIPDALNGLDVTTNSSHNNTVQRDDFLNSPEFHTNDLTKETQVNQPIPEPKTVEEAVKLNPIYDNPTADPFAEKIKEAEGEKPDLEKPAFTRGLFSGFKRHHKEKVDRDAEF